MDQEKKMKKIILVNPSSASVYEGVKIKEGALYNPALNLAVIAAPLLVHGHDVLIVDMNMPEGSEREQLLRLLKNFAPEYVGVTFTTPLYEEAAKICRWVKEYDEGIKTIAGGVHATAFPEKTLLDMSLDVVVIGEGDFTLLDILEADDISTVRGVCYKDQRGFSVRNPGRERIVNLDELPLPAWRLYDIKKYHTTDLLAKKSPAGWLETSRGCMYGCVYCSKSVHGYAFRAKSPQRVVNEIRYMLDLGFKEIHISDDCFNTDMERAKEICRLIIKSDLKFPWSTISGIRVDKVDKELLSLMRKAGCYRVVFGLESGDARILKNIKKGITLEQAVFAVKTAKEAGLEVLGYLMIGLPGETEESMRKTIDFALTLDMDIAKMAITVPLPSTPLYNEWLKEGFIKEAAWSKFNLNTIPAELYDHPTLAWDKIEREYKRFYRAFYLRPSYILKRFIYSVKNRRLISNLRHFINTNWS